MTQSTEAGSDTSRTFNVLFLCTANSARSIMAEAALKRYGNGRFNAYSAGSHPRGSLDPTAMQVLERLHYDTAGYRSKSWDEFAGEGAPQLDFVFTVCDRAAGEVCPLWPGQPMTAHWGVDDPDGFVGTEEKRWAFYRRIYYELERRVQLFSSLRFEGLERLSLQNKLDEIGKKTVTADEVATLP